MTATINNEDQVAHSRRVLANEGNVFSSFNVEDFAVPHGEDEEWKFTPLRKLHGLHSGTAADPVAASISVKTAGQDGVAVNVVKRDNKRLNHAGTPTDHVAAQAYSNFDNAHAVTLAENSISEEPVVIDIDDPGGDNVSYGHIVIDAQSHAKAVCIINYRGNDTFADNIEFTISGDAKLSVMTMVNWNENAVHGSAHHTRVGRGAALRHTVATFGDEAVRVVPCVTFAAPGGSVDLLGIYSADVGQYSENRMLVDHAVPNCRSSVMYKGALQGKPNVIHREAHTVWVGDVLTRAETTGIDTYKLDRNLLPTEGVRTDTVPNSEIKTGEIAGAERATIVGRFDEEQLFYPLSRGTPELTTRRLVIRGFFSEVINLTPVGSVREKLEKLVGEKLSTAGF